MTFQEFKSHVNGRVAELYADNLSNHDKLIEITGLTAEPINGRIGGQTINMSLQKIEEQLNKNTESNKVIDFSDVLTVNLDGCSILTVKEMVEGICHLIVDKSNQ